MIVQCRKENLGIWSLCQTSARLIWEPIQRFELGNGFPCHYSFVHKYRKSVCSWCSMQLFICLTIPDTSMCLMSIVNVWSVCYIYEMCFYESLAGRWKFIGWYSFILGFIIQYCIINSLILCNPDRIMNSTSGRLVGDGVSGWNEKSG